MVEEYIYYYIRYMFRRLTMVIFRLYMQYLAVTRDYMGCIQWGGRRRDGHEISCHFLCCVYIYIYIYIFFLNRVVYEIMWKNNVKPQMTIWRMRTTCWKPKATNTPSEYVILISSARQQLLHERASMLRYTYIVCLVIFRNIYNVIYLKV